jgi:hypothetical protein
MIKKKSNIKLASASSMRLALESRLLFDGAVVATAAQVMDDKAAQDQGHEATKDSNTDAAPADATIDAAKTSVAYGDLIHTKTFEQQPQAITSVASAGNKEAPTLIVVDARAEGTSELLKNPPANTDIRVLDVNRDGFQQIAEILQERGNTSDIEVLTAGVGGKQWLGSSQLTPGISTTDSNSLIDWGDGLAYNANVVFIGQEAISSTWLEHVNALTGVQVSWSKDSVVDHNKTTTNEKLIDTKTAATADHEKTPAAVGTDGAHAVKSLVFIETNVKDYQTLLKGIDPKATSYCSILLKMA